MEYMHYIQNPILKGFNPDPSITRDGDDYYIAVSTFEWYPGVQIHHSRDLQNWRLAARPLNRASQLDMRGNPDSCGIWAPCLSYSGGQFWLIYTDMKRKMGSFKDAHNYLVTAPSIEGPWSDPIYLNSTGFDPSLFHDDDGRKWLLNLQWDHRGKPSRFGGIVAQEYDPAAQRLIGTPKVIFTGSSLGSTEGPHLYRRDDRYHLMVAEGGTGYRHTVTMARSDSLFGPYELHPDTHIMTARHVPDAELQRAGHGDLIETQSGETYMVHLCSRPLAGLDRSVLGRETAIQRCVWGEDGWLRLDGPPLEPQSRVRAPDLPLHPFPPEPEECTFTGPDLPSPFQWLRSPYPARLFSLTDHPGHLRLFGRESIGSWFEQSLVARRQTGFDYDAETVVEAAPDHYGQMAGLIAYYARFSYFYLCLTHDDTAGRCLNILYCDGGWPNGMTLSGLDTPAPVSNGPVHMRMEVRGPALRFFWKQAGDWQRIGPVLNASTLSDEGGEGEFKGRMNGARASGSGFTGAFVGMAAHDVTGRAMPADFARFAYRNL